MIECRSLSGDIPGDLIGACEIKPIVGIVWIEGNRGAKVFDSRLRVAGDKGKVAPETVTIVCVTRRKPNCKLQSGQLRTRDEKAGGKLFADEKQVEADEKNHDSSQLPASRVG